MAPLQGAANETFVTMDHIKKTALVSFRKSGIDLRDQFPHVLRQRRSARLRGPSDCCGTTE